MFIDWLVETVCGLQQKGEDLQRVHCPIGVEIRAERQIEIAFSIVSQLIPARAQ